MKIVLKMITILLSSMLVVTPVFADVARNVEIIGSPAKSVITFNISGVPGDTVVLQVLNFGRSFEDLDSITSANVKDVLMYANQKTVDESGLTQFKLMFDETVPDGVVNYLLYYHKSGKVVKDSFMYYSPSAVNALLEDLYNAADDSAAAQIIKANREALQVNTPLFERYVLKNKESLKAVQAVRTQLYDIHTLSDFKATFQSILVEDAINQLRDNDDLDLLLSQNSEISIADYLGLSTDENAHGEDAIRYNKYLSWDSAKKNALYTKLRTKPHYTKEEFLAYFAEFAFVTDLNSSINWESIDQLIYDNTGLLSNAAAYKALTDTKRAQVAVKLYDKRNVSSSAEFNTCIAEAIDSINVSPPRNGGGGGGGGGRTVSIGTGFPVETKGVSDPPVQTGNVVTAQNITVPFIDLDSVPWAKEAIEVMYVKGVVNGKSEKEFKPNDKITREEFVKMAVLAFGLRLDNATTHFIDVPVDAWYYVPVATAHELNIVNGITETEFGVGQNLTRQQLAVLGYRFANAAGILLSELSEYIPFDDDHMIDDYAKEAVAALASANIVSGVGNNLFAPHEACTRAEAVKILYSIYKLSLK